MKGGGVRAIKYTLATSVETGPKKLWDTLTSKNACKTCALGMGGQQGGMRNEEGHWPEVCKKSIQAQISDLQAPIQPEFFASTCIEEIAKLSGRDMERLGRLNTPLMKAAGDSHYTPVTWDQALNRVIERFNETDPDRTFFYSSGRSSNEAAFILHLMARMYGTNNVNNCSYYCHQASGVGLASAIGTGTATVELADIAGADTIFVIGANPASNHPRFVRELVLCRRRGGNVVVVNPLKEGGLVKFAIPSMVSSMVKGGDEVASHYYQPRINGDLAWIYGVAKEVLEQGAQDQAYIDAYTTGFEEFAKKVQETSWEDIEASSGLPRAEIIEIAHVYIRAKNAVFCWAMGITHHENGCENVEAIAALALLRGMIGRKHAGLSPLRGHSNVQGVGSVGVTPVLKQSIFDNIQNKLGVTLPTKPGLDTMACMDAGARGEIDVAFMLGGNLYGSNPDLSYAEKSLNTIPTKVYMTTTINPTHVHGVDGEVIILPVATRDEEPQKTTQESMFNFVRLSDGGPSRLDNVRSETHIIAHLAQHIVGNDEVNFKAFEEYQHIREAIAEIVPGFEDIKTIEATKKEFHIKGRVHHTPSFNTPDGKAAFRVANLPMPTQTDEFDLMTIRSEGQFNTVIYEEYDLYRDQEGRWIVLMNPDDIHALGTQHKGKVHVHNATGTMESVEVREYDIARGCVAAYFPEANVLVPTTTDGRSKTPAFKQVKVTISVA